MGVEALGPEATVEGLDEGVVRWFAGSREVQCDAALIGPQVKIARHKLAALIDADRRQRSLGNNEFWNNPSPVTARVALHVRQFTAVDKQRSWIVQER